MFYIFLAYPFAGLLQFLVRRGSLRLSDTKGDRRNNDRNNVTGLAVLLLIPWGYGVFCFPTIILDGHSGFMDIISHFGYMLLPQICLLIASVYLFRTRKLIVQEWEKNPPEFVRREKIEKEQKEAEDKASRNLEQYHTLIEQCGVRFFIKYYRKIVRLPLRDVAVSENYSHEEQAERLNAAKKIVDLGLSELAFKEIVRQYGDILEDTEIKQAREILDSLHGESDERKTDDNAFKETEQPVDPSGNPNSMP